MSYKIISEMSNKEYQKFRPLLDLIVRAQKLGIDFPLKNGHYQFCEYFDEPMVEVTTYSLTAWSYPPKEKNNSGHTYFEAITLPEAERLKECMEKNVFDTNESLWYEIQKSSKTISEKDLRRQIVRITGIVLLPDLYWLTPGSNTKNETKA